MPYTLLNKKQLPKSRLELTLEIDSAAIAEKREHVLEEAAKEAEMDGFRKGKVPKELARKRMGELALWEEAAMCTLLEALAEIFKKEALHVIGRPEISVTKLAPENPAGFKVTLSLFPKLALPDYKELAVTHNAKPAEEAKADEKEVDEVVAHIVKEHERRTNAKEFKISDETVGLLGAFTSVADLRSKVTEGLTAHKKIRAAERRRAELLDKTTEGVKGEIPDVLIEHELDRLEGEFKGELERLGTSFEQYLAEIKKDRGTMRKEWRQDAEKRARLELLLAEIARAEKIIASPEEVAAGVKHILEHYKDAERGTARLFVENLVLNRKTIEWLEQQK